MIKPILLNRFNEHYHNLIKIKDLSALFPTLFEYYARNDSYLRLIKIRCCQSEP